MTTYLSFLVAATLLALTPGPDVLLVVTVAAKEGFQSALKLTLGLATGVIFHTTLIILGFSALIAQSQHGLTIIAVFGAGYLLYLAWMTWRHMGQSSEPSEPDEAPALSGSRYWRGVIMNITNPKVLLFFLALFPQFATLDQPGFQWRVAILGLLFIGVTIVVFGSLAYLTAKSTQNLMQNPKYQHAMDVVTIGVFLLLAGLLIYSVVS